MSTDKLDPQLVNECLTILDEVKCQLAEQDTDEINKIISALENSFADWSNLDKDIQINRYAVRKMLVILNIHILKDARSYRFRDHNFRKNETMN